MNWSNVIVVVLSIVGTSPEPQRLTTDGLVKTSPVFVDRSGDELLYVVEDLPTRMRLMRLRLTDGRIEPVHPDETRAEFEPACSADGRKLAFVQSRGNLNLVLVIHDLVSGRDLDVPVGSGFAGPRSPCFTPDGSRVVYSFADASRQKLFWVGTSDPATHVLVDSQGVNNWPDVSSDGKRLVFASSRDGDYDLFTADADGKNQNRLAASPNRDVRPRYSPDGRRIAFTSGRDGNDEIYVCDADGRNPQRVTHHPERDDYAAWHPDGRRLVVVCERSGRHDLYLIDVP
jgi:Tol biopolymer transport system component